MSEPTLSTFEQFLADETGRWGLSLSAGQLAHFAHYRHLLTEWNERLNLTRIIDPLELTIRHFLDSLSCVIVMGELSGRSLIDVGTGAGFPGLPLKIFCPELKLTLVDSVAKKTQFLQEVVHQLGLTEVQVAAERAETLGQNPAYREQYDWVVARSVAELRILVEYLLPLCKVGGQMLAQKGDNGKSELNEARFAIPVLGGGTATVKTIALPQVEMPHYLLLIPKLKPTPAKYPRRPGQPSKKPL